MHVKEVWRYPVKSMAGEQLEQATLGPLGIDGDWTVMVVNSRGRAVTARTHPGLLGHHATFGDDRTPRVDGRAWTDATVLADVRKIAGPDASLIHDESPNRFDIMPLLVTTDGAIEALGRDRRRLRPNIIIGGVEGLAERDWEGRRLRIGKVVIYMDSLRGRCVMTTYDPDTQEHDPSVLFDIVRRFDGKMALNSTVEHGGSIAVGQPVELH